MMDKISFTVNGEHYTLSGTEVSPMTSLNDFLRNSLQLHGTKAMCREGGCGACIVSIVQTHPVTKEKHTFSVNSCLVHVLSCHQWDITTIEGVGNRKDGYHEIQSRLAAFNGTQCGYCTPGWVMNMYSLQEGSNAKLTTTQVERSFGGNLCRCTGYRPIVDAFKTFASDAETDLRNKLQDLEDLHEVKCLKKCQKRCSESEEDWCVLYNKENTMLEVGGESSRWYKAYTVEDVFKVLNKEGLDSYKVISGNTGSAIYAKYWDALPRVFIDISSIESLKTTYADVNYYIGSGTTLTELMSFFKRKQSEKYFDYFGKFYQHLDLVAHVPVRNIGTIGGNLALKNSHNEFPSDIFLLLQTVEAVVVLVDQTLKKSNLSMQDFLKADLKGRLITTVCLPPLTSQYLVRTYKIMPRAQNALAIVNAGFCIKVDSSNEVEHACIVYSPISQSFVRASKTEKVLLGQQLFSDVTLQKALVSLDRELQPTVNPNEASPACKKAIALGLLYKTFLSLAPQSSLNPRYVSGGAPLQRPTSRGTQTFDTDKTLWPLNEPIPKLEALAQCSGEVKYACDVVPSRREVLVALVLSTICKGEIDRFDAEEALKTPGVIGFFTSEDIPGKNSFIPISVPWQHYKEELLASKTISYYGQPVALVAAVTQTLALHAADLVKVYYHESREKPVLSIKDALNAPDKDTRLRQMLTITPKSKGQDTKHVIHGSFYMPSQYHFTMETQSCSVTHTDDGLAVRSATQWMDLVQVAVAQVLDLDHNKVTVTVGRLGGGYGGKASRSALTACACALTAHKLNRDARIVLPLAHNMAALGKRQDCYAEYEVGVNDDGLIQYLEMSMYSDCGSGFNDMSTSVIREVLQGLYASDCFSVKGYGVLTDKPNNTWCRAPGTTEAIAILENIMEEIGFATKKDPIEVRKINLSPQHQGFKDVIDSFKRDSSYNDRKVQIAKFNSENAWKKRGLNLSIMNYPIGYDGTFPVTLTVYHADGSIAISHGGIEMGQGINTKVAQVCAYTLKVPLEKITVVSSNSFTSPNAIATSGSVTSECVAFATVKACNELLQKLEPFRNDMNDPTWEELVKKAFEGNVNLQTIAMNSPNDRLQAYDVYGVCVTEVELDVLTGQHQVNRVDLLEDTGVSLSPYIDVGQIEGAFVMGLGLWTSEELLYDDSGRLASSTWHYHPPGVNDIPADFRVSFRRNSPNQAGVLRSKATGEPALTLAITVCSALKNAIMEARKEFGYKDDSWLKIDTPFTVQNIVEAISPKYSSFKLK